jgi:hypothetical protein
MRTEEGRLALLDALNARDSVGCIDIVAFVQRREYTEQWATQKKCEGGEGDGA